MGIVSVVVFCSTLVVVGILVYIFRKQFFGIPDYKSPLFGVQVWYGKEKINGLEKIDSVLTEFIVLVNKDFPGISFDSLKKCFGILKIKFCSSNDLSIYVPLEDFKKVFPELTPKEIKEFNEEYYVMVNGKCNFNNLFIRNIGTDIIRDTALVHEIVHYIIEAYQLAPSGDIQHKGAIFWEGTGWVSKVLSKFQ